MILDRLDHLQQYVKLHPLFGQAFGFLQRADLEHLESGKYDIVEGQVFADVSDCTGRLPTGTKLETHQRYIDIQVTLSGREVIGWRDRKSCGGCSEGYDESRDIEFYSTEIDTWLTLLPGYAVIFFPEDAHAPLAGEGTIRKLVIKVAVDSLA